MKDPPCPGCNPIEVGKQYIYLDDPVTVTRIVPCRGGPATVFFRTRWDTPGSCDDDELSPIPVRPARPPGTARGPIGPRGAKGPPGRPAWTAELPTTPGEYLCVSEGGARNAFVLEADGVWCSVGTGNSRTTQGDNILRNYRKFYGPIPND